MKRLYFDIKKCLGCKSCVVACSVGHSISKNLLKALSEKPRSLSRIKVQTGDEHLMPMSCRHCDDPKCVDACIAGALSYDYAKKMVNHNKDKCVGCWMCVMVCPYGAIKPDKETKLAVRCDLCSDVDEPRCVVSCPVKAIVWEEEELAKKK